MYGKAEATRRTEETTGVQVSLARRLCALVIGIAAAPLYAENRLILPNVVVRSGGEDAIVVRAEHDFPLAGFVVSLRYDPAHISVRTEDITSDGTDVDGLSFFQGPHEPDSGQIGYAGIIDFRQVVTLPPTAGGEAPHSLMRILFTNVAPPGTVSEIALVDGLEWEFVPPTRNALVDDRATSFFPQLVAGSITTPAALSVDAGANQVVAEGDRVTLAASVAGAVSAGAVTYNWRQLTSLPLQEASASDAAEFAFTVPPIPASTGDIVYHFEVEVSDGLETRADRVVVAAQNLVLLRVEAGEDTVVDGGTRVTLAATVANPQGPVDFVWQQVSGPVADGIVGADTRILEFTAPVSPEETVLTFEVAASDGFDTVADTVTLTVRPPVVAVEFTRGDANGDILVDLSDAILVLGFSFLGDGEIRCADAADANDDGTIDISDAVTVLDTLFVSGTPLPPPGAAACGVDPTPDELDCESYEGCG
jgi:uncharacterized protein YuzE